MVLGQGERWRSDQGSNTIKRGEERLKGEFGNKNKSKGDVRDYDSPTIGLCFVNTCLISLSKDDFITCF